MTNETDRLEAYVIINNKQFGIAYDHAHMLEAAAALINLLVQTLDVPFQAVEPSDNNGLIVLAQADLVHEKQHKSRVFQIVETLKYLWDHGDLGSDYGPGSHRFKISRLHLIYDEYQKRPDNRDLRNALHAELLAILSFYPHEIEFINAYYPKPHWQSVFYMDVLRTYFGEE